MLFILC